MFGKIFKCCGRKEDIVPAAPTTEHPVGTKKAFLVGINKLIAPGNDLNGCVNDVNAMWEKLTDSYGFNPDDIEMLCDYRATQDAIMAGVKKLVEGAKPYDLIVFQYSGHGTAIRIPGEHEECQCLVPTDMDWDDPLTDKMLAAEFKKLPLNSFMTFICDACHSGSIDRDFAPVVNPHPSASRFLAPPSDIAVRVKKRKLSTNRMGWRDLRGPNGENTTFLEQRHMLVSGCRDDQTSADAYIDGKYQGAMTASLLKALDTFPGANWLSAHEEMVKWLAENNYTQVPQLSGPKIKLEYKVFGE